MKEINWDEAPEGFPVWIEAGDGVSGWHRDVGDRYEDQGGFYRPKPEGGFYTVYNKPENNLKYKVGDVVVLGDNVGVNHRKTFVPGAVVEIMQLCCVDRPEDAHYTIELVSSSGGQWWVKDDEINHEATKYLQLSNKTASLVQETTPKNDDSSERDSQPMVDNNSWFERGELPPIGSKVVFYSDDFENEDYWNKDLTNESEVEVVAHIASSVKRQEIDLAVFVFQHPDGYCQVEQAVSCCFRPIRTAEEIEAGEREKAVGAVEEQILEQMGELNVRNLAEHIVDTFDLRFTKEGK